MFSGKDLDSLHVWSEYEKITEDEWMNDNYGQSSPAGEGPKHYISNHAKDTDDFSFGPSWDINKSQSPVPRL